ncbi:Reverse transcriptase [Arachis hypogaea]|nr:Reverse transcriptase [Arachis hypogaea]
MGYIGGRFTWWNKSYQERSIRKRLDRALISSSLRLDYPMATITHLEETGSDHKLILMSTNPLQVKAKRRFRFQERCCGKEETDHIIEEAWKKEVIGSPMFYLFQKLKGCQHELVKWQASEPSNSKKEIMRLEGLLSAAKENPTLANKEHIMELEKTYPKRVFWKEKSPVRWLR